MKMKKIAALMLACCVLASVAGCSKVKPVTAEEVADACDELGFEECDPDEVDIDDADMEDGIYFVMDRDFIEEGFANAGPYLRASGIDMGIDFDNIEEVTVFARWDAGDFDDVEDPEDLADVRFDAVAGLQITLDEYDQDVLYDISDGVDDLLRKIDVDIEDLSSSEYKLNKDSMFLKLHVDGEAFIAAFLESEFYDALMDSANGNDQAEEFADVLEELTGDISVAIYVADGNILIVGGASLNGTADYIDEFCSTIGVDDPTDLPSSQVVIDGLIETMDDYADLFRSSYSYDDLDEDFEYFEF